MSFIGTVEAKLPPGFRFHPRDDELICDYLASKTAAAAATPFAGSFHGNPSMVDVDLNKCEPWDLPAAACVGGKEWYFYSLRDRKYATGQRTNRATTSGYWKATGKDRPVARRGSLVGMRKTLVFYGGRAPKGKRTDWVMHEFRMESGSPDPAPAPAPPNNLPFKKEDWVLCKVFYKSRSMSTDPSPIHAGVSSTLQTLLSATTDTTTGNITFHQTQIPMEGFGQVPCFSSLDPGRASQHHRRPHAASHLLPSVPKHWPQTGGGGLPQLTGPAESGVKGEGTALSLGEEGRSPVGVGCLAQTGLPPAWNPFFGWGERR